MDGDELLVFSGACVVPFGFKDERVRRPWFDLFNRVPPERFAEFVKQQHAAARVTPRPVDGSYTLPLAKSSYFAALTGEERVVNLWIQQTAQEFQYNLSHYLLEPIAPGP
jgi:hypothetical protein